MYSLLIADDLRIDRETAASSIEWDKLGINLVAQVANGVQAIEYLQRNPVDFVLTDVEMPEMNGISLAHEIKKKGMQTIVAFMSHHYEVDYLQSAIDLRAASYIVKPVDSVRVEKLFSDLIIKKNEERRLARIIEESRALLTNQFMHRLCNGLYASEDEALAIARLVMNPGNIQKLFMIVIISVPYAYDPDEMMLRLQLSWNIDNLCSEQKTGIGGQADDIYYVVLFSGDSVEMLKTVTQRMVLSLEPIVGNSGRVVSGQPCEGLLPIAKSYSGAREILRKKLLEEVNSPNLELGDMQAKFDPSHLLEQIRYHLQNGEKHKNEAFINETVSELADMKNANMVVCALNTIAVAVNAVLCENGLSIDSLQCERLWWHDPESTKMPDTIKEWMVSLFHSSTTVLRALQGNGVNNVVSDVFRYINQNIAQEITVSKIANELYFSPNYLNLIFKQNTGQTIREYVQYARMEKAKQLLRNRSITINNIMKLVGYHKASYFNKVFKEYVGMTPKQFRGMK